jgi:16S rRNA G966 N2-methylase RsmD
MVPADPLAAFDPRPLLDGKVTLYAGDCRAVMAAMAENSVDAVVSDPPYELGFMSKSWDSTGVAFDPATWRAALRVLKPGGHLVAFAAARNAHRMKCAIEDAGFEIRDSMLDLYSRGDVVRDFFEGLDAEQRQAFGRIWDGFDSLAEMAWLYGTGFPKSHDVSAAIDKLDAVGLRRARALAFTCWLRSTGLTATRIDALTQTNMGGHYVTEASQPAVPTRAHFEILRPHIAGEIPAWVEAAIDERAVESETFKRREVIGKHAGASKLREWVKDYAGDAAPPSDPASITKAHSLEARQWGGWGTALKPAHEPIVVARKPLGEKTVAANVVKWGTGAVHIDACRIATGGGDVVKTFERAAGDRHRDQYRTGTTIGAAMASAVGRHPANIVHDGSADVEALFPSDGKASPERVITSKAHASVANGANGDRVTLAPAAGGGSAARFYYSGKADRDDRAGSKHPTVKPPGLMRWLTRFVTPPGGIVLDPFGGTGSTGLAAYLEGFDAILIEREPKYRDDIARKLEASRVGGSMKGQLQMSAPTTSPDSIKSICSPALADGPGPCASPDGATIARRGPARVRANRSPCPASKKDSTIHATSGPNSATSSRSENLQRCLASNLRTRLDGSPSCEVIWKPWVTPWGACLSRPRALARTITGTAIGLWPTATTQSGGQTLPPGTTLAGRRPDGSKAQVTLQNVVQALWSTLRATDGAKGGPNMSFGGSPLPSQVFAAGSSSNAPTENGARSLHPAFAGWEMHYPPEWIACAGLETRSTLARRRP